MATKVKSVAAKAPTAVKKPSTKPSHPPTAEMVNAAISELKDRKGSSLQAIKKYVAATYKIDADKFSPFIKKYLKSAVASGILLQPKGHGASGSFKLAMKVSEKKKVTSQKKVIAPKASSEKKRKTTKVAAKPPKAKSTTAKPKKASSPMKKASVRSTTAKPKAASPMKKTSAPKIKKPTAKKVAK